MNAEIIAVGTELLHGDILNSNAQYISQRLATIGVDVHYHTVVGDNPERIKNIFAIAMQRADVLVVTGGLGPTKDDITKEMLADVLNRPMEYSQESFERMKKRFEEKNRTMTDNNLRQNYFPQDATVLPNYNGTADACLVEVDGKKIFLLPGPPKENQPLMEDEVLPFLKRLSPYTVVYRKIEVFNLGESTSETMLMDLIDSQSNPTIAPYAGQGHLIYRITAKADSKEEAEQMLEPLVREVLIRLGENAVLLEE